ncbi:hypothetical protein KQX54_001849 [Cotesia glomerata]|uniref:Uncharacterized protein n=1 Tax=Cotesia glomerata TaxID=32391 RepID=A0AAV7IHG4_COTGL|nr:hypothetical protein KQX54_001849 [Cotesia glomerata]
MESENETNKQGARDSGWWDSGEGGRVWGLDWEWLALSLSVRIPSSGGLKLYRTITSREFSRFQAAPACTTVSSLPVFETYTKLIPTRMFTVLVLVLAKALGTCKSVNPNLEKWTHNLDYVFHLKLLSAGPSMRIILTYK